MKLLLLLPCIPILTSCASRPTPYSERFAIVPDCKPAKVPAYPDTLPAPDSDTFLDPEMVYLTVIDKLAQEKGITWEAALQLYGCQNR